MSVTQRIRNVASEFVGKEMTEDDFVQVIGDLLQEASDRELEHIAKLLTTIGDL